MHIGKRYFRFLRFFGNETLSKYWFEEINANESFAQKKLINAIIEYFCTKNIVETYINLSINIFFLSQKIKTPRLINE